jgi:hypothetical protein
MGGMFGEDYGKEMRPEEEAANSKTRTTVF